MAAAGPWGSAPAKSVDIIIKIGKLQQYTELVGWDLEKVLLNEDDIILDEKIGILKIAPVGEVVHGVGMKATEEEFYVMRQPKF